MGSFNWRPWRWTIDKLSQRVKALEGVYDVMPEYAAPGRYLLHVWAVMLDDLEPRIRGAVRKRPRGIKIDVLLYRREIG